jgi:hypothetical protein
MPKPIFFPKDLLVEETPQAARRRTRQARAKAQVRSNTCKQRSPGMRIQVDALQKYAYKQESLQNDRGLTNLMTHLT